ncbi:MAG: helix-turn-helix transcriptional regulator [Planctomycetaceae bacterium]
MIRTEQEYHLTLQKLADQEGRIRQQEEQLKTLGIDKSGIKRVLDPIRSFSAQLREEIETYEGLKRGEFPEIENFVGMGQMLIALRVAKGLTQRELAQRMGVNESQVSRDERNEYHGVTLDRAQRILEALNVRMTTTIQSSGPMNKAG